MKLIIKHHFEAAHRLALHEGKCRNLHGHRWDVRISLMGPKEEKSGMIIDFGNIKELIDHYLDHATLISNHHYNDDIEKALVGLNCKVEIFNFEPTAENLVYWIWRLIWDKYPNGLHYLKVELWESPTGKVEYERYSAYYREVNI